MAVLDTNPPSLEREGERRAGQVGRSPANSLATRRNRKNPCIRHPYRVRLTRRATLKRNGQHRRWFLRIRHYQNWSETAPWKKVWEPRRARSVIAGDGGRHENLSRN